MDYEKYVEIQKGYGYEINMTESSFNRRNEGGFYAICMSLFNKNLVESDDMAWHSTYVLTDFGKLILNLYEKTQNGEQESL